jgi:hypothetical protein
MGLMDEWGDALVEEGLREAADTFFGARRALEEDVVYLEDRAAKLRVQAEEIRAWFGGLNCLLGSEANSRSLFEAVGVRLPDPDYYTQTVCSLQFRRPHSFTRKGLFFKTLWEVYRSLAGKIESYMHGSPYTDPLHPGRVMVTLHLEQVRRHCDDINRRIRTVNESNRPSESLAFAKRLDQGQVRKESITGGGGQAWTLDQDMAFKSLNFESFNLPVFPDLPVDAKARSAVEACCGRIFSNQRLQVDAVLDDILDPTDKTMCVLERR